MDKKVVVISGTNLIDAGPLSVYLDFLNSIIECGYNEQYKIIALVGKKELFKRFENKIDIIEFRNSKKNWLNRLYLEYFGFKKLSLKMDVDIWISMHDITPNVQANHRYVYCHNPSPFNKMSIKDIKFGYKYYLFSKLYKYLYKINIKKNDAVIVQQEWMRKEFIKLYNPREVVVSRPSLPNISNIVDTSKKDECIFIFPSFPRYYKNFQVACESAKVLNEKGVNNFKLYLTLSGTENKYSQYLKKEYGNIKSICFTGLLPRYELFDLYAKSSCLIFMSKLETWGMPITEYKITGKPILVADLPYAHETVGEYDNVEFIDSDDVDLLCTCMEKVINNEKLSSSCPIDVQEPYMRGWTELCKYIFGKGDIECV